MSDALPLRLTLVTPPPIEPISVAEAKLHARIDETADDTLVAALITAAREMAESYTRRAFVTQTWKMFLDAFPSDTEIELPKAPLQSVTHVKTYDDADVATVFAASGYFVDASTRPGRIVLRDAASWPTTATRVANAIEVQFICGYGNAPTDVPLKIRQAMLLTIAHLYEHRGDANEEMPYTACTLLDSERTWLV